MNINTNDYVVVNGKKYYAEGGIKYFDNGGPTKKELKQFVDWNSNRMNKKSLRGPTSWRSGDEKDEDFAKQFIQNMQNYVNPNDKNKLTLTQAMHIQDLLDSVPKYVKDEDLYDVYNSEGKFAGFEDSPELMNLRWADKYNNIDDIISNRSLMFKNVYNSPEFQNKVKEFLSTKRGNGSYIEYKHPITGDDMYYRFYIGKDGAGFVPDFNAKSKGFEPIVTLRGNGIENTEEYEIEPEKREIYNGEEIVIPAKKGRRFIINQNEKNRIDNGYSYGNFYEGSESNPVNLGTGEKIEYYNNLKNLNANDQYKQIKENHAYGGPTTRLFASGGDMGAIPMGEQPDYNMVGAGGSHEMNPQGGVPYGMNTDGSQNMVEQGEVSVGNNVFSDRTAISPELCQQLGLPEGTSHAQAMQQIEALYEQGQIGEQEYQEISQILFQDQEAQKQGGGMPQPQNEGIQPEMVAPEGYAWGGRRRCR